MTPQLQKKVASWVENGLITAEQAERIAAHEGRGADRPWVLYGIAGVGVTALVTGVVSLVAANWEEIPVWFKLATYFALQAGVGYGFYRHAARAGLIRETCLTTFVPLLLAGIGLIAQTYNLHGDGWQALLLWVIIGFPAVWLAQSWAVVYLWTAALLVTSVIWGEAADYAGLPEFGRVCLVASVPLWLLASGFWGERVRRWNPYFRTTAQVWGTVVVLAAGTPLANMLWFDTPSSVREHLGYLMFPWLALGAAIAGVWFRPGAKRDLQLSMTGMLTSVGVFLTLPLLFGGSASESTGTQLFAAAGFFVTWLFAAAAAAYSHHKRWFDLASLVIALRVVIVYFEVFGSLAMTGLGLIFSGIVILAIAFMWHRFRVRVRQQLGGES